VQRNIVEKQLHTILEIVLQLLMSLHEKSARGFIDEIAWMGLPSLGSVWVREYTRNRKSMDRVVDVVESKDNE
jgi:hypothetical protein